MKFVTLIACNTAVTELLKLAANRSNGFCAPKLYETQIREFNVEVAKAIAQERVPRHTGWQIADAPDHADCQSVIQIQVFNDERVVTKDNLLLGKFHIDEVPSAPHGVRQAEVTSCIDANESLNVCAQDKVQNGTVKQRIDVLVAHIRKEIGEVIQLISQERVFDRVIEPIIDPPIPQIQDQVVEVLKVIFQKRLQQHTADQMEVTHHIRQERVSDRVVDQTVNIPSPHMQEQTVEVVKVIP